MNYMVVESKLSYAIVLDESGRFLKVANQNFEIGQTVNHVIVMKENESKPFYATNQFMSGLIALAAVLVIAFTFLFNQMPNSMNAFATIILKINPEVRIQLNQDEIVTNLQGVNSDGQELISGYDFENKKYDLVVDELVDRAIELGFLYDGGQIQLSFDSESDEWVTLTSETMKEHMGVSLKEKVKVTIVLEDVKHQSQQIIVPVIPVDDDSDYQQPTQPQNPVPVPTDDSDYDDQTGNDVSDYEVNDVSDYEVGDASDYEIDDSGYDD